MRHRKSFNHLGRKTGHRKAMLANMASSLIKHKRITTTTAKAKALRVFVEPLITKSKDDTTHSRRIVFSYLQDKDAVSELFREVAGKVAERPGGYTRILKLGNRLGDSAEMAIIELVDFNENLLGGDDAGKAGGRKRRRGTKKKSETGHAAPVSPSDGIEEAQVVEESATEVGTIDQPVAEEAEAPVAEAAPETEVTAEETSEDLTDQAQQEESKEEENKEDEEQKES